MKLNWLLSILVFSQFSLAANLPSQPKSTDHPGSDSYTYGVMKEVFQENGRDVNVYLPETTGEQVPVVVFGHGQASPLEAYEATFMHLAGKGVAVIFPEYSSGFFDQNWRRMGADYANLAKAAADRFPVIDQSAVVFAGHSKGGYVAGVSAGLDDGLRPSALVLFTPAGYDAQAWSRVSPEVPVTIVFGDKDDIVEESLVREIFERSQVNHKQYIDLKSYSMTSPNLEADHFFPFSKRTWVGGRDGISPFHFYGVFGWLIGAAEDAQAGNPLEHPFVYGDRVVETGVQGFEHGLTRNW